MQLKILIDRIYFFNCLSVVILLKLMFILFKIHLINLKMRLNLFCFLFEVIFFAFLNVKSLVISQGGLSATEG